MEGESYFGHPWEDSEDEASRDIRAAKPLTSIKDAVRQLVSLSGSAEPSSYNPQTRHSDDQLPALSSAYTFRLIKTHDTLARLETGLSLAHETVRTGLIARVSLAEASGFLAHRSAYIHRFDLALRQAGITGSYATASMTGRLKEELFWTGVDKSEAGEEVSLDLPDEVDVDAALAYADLWRRLTMRAPVSLKTPHLIIGALKRLGCHIEDDGVIEDWLNDLPTEFGKPGLLQPAWVVSKGVIGHPRDEHLDLASAYLAAVLWRNGGYNKECPLPLFSAPTQTLNRLGRETRQEFERTFLECVGESALFALRELTRLTSAMEKVQDMRCRENSNLRAVALMAISHPVITVPRVAEALSISSRSALDQINKLVEIKLIQENTGRASWRAYQIT